MKQHIIVLSLMAALTTVVKSEPFVGTIAALGSLYVAFDFLWHALENGRSRRSIGNANAHEMFLKASLLDVDDCAKNLVCQLSTKSIESMDALERTVFAIYGQDASIDLSRADVEFQLAANIGRQAGIQQCLNIYARCPWDYRQLLHTIEGTPNHLYILENQKQYELEFKNKFPYEFTRTRRSIGFNLP